MIFVYLLLLASVVTSLRKREKGARIFLVLALILSGVVLSFHFSSLGIHL